MNELEKLLVAHPRYEKCQWLIKPRLNGKTPSYPVIRLAQGVTPSLVLSKHSNLLTPIWTTGKILKLFRVKINGSESIHVIQTI